MVPGCCDIPQTCRQMSRFEERLFVRTRLVYRFAALIALVLLVLVGCGNVEESSDSRTTSQVDDALEADDMAEVEEVRAQDSAPRGVRVTYVDVGKGDCILVQAGGAATLIDTGYEETADEVLDCLRNNGVSRLSCVVITHYDKDHVGGVRAIGEACRIDTVYLPGYTGADKQYRSVASAVKDLGLSAQQVTQQTSLRLGPARLDIFPSSLTYVPNANGDEGNDNDLSLVLGLTHGNDSYLFAGDLEKEGIDAYLEAGHGTFDVLKMPHHGEKSGNTDELLDDVKLQIAIITDGADDPADKKTLKLLKTAGVEVYRTAADGTIVVTSDGTGSYAVSCEGM